MKASAPGLHLVLLCAALSMGCSVPVAADLEEGSANRIVVALDEGGVTASKQPDPNHEGRWRVLVPRDDSAAAVAVLEQRNLPPPTSPGVLEALGEGALVPSRTSEHARLVTGMAGELERSLRDVEGVLAARVHLAVPPKDALGIGDTPEAPTASVLLRHRGATPPMTQSDIQRLVAGAVPGLSAEEVSVVTTPVPEALTRRERPLAHFGPITVARTSLTSLRIAVAIIVTLLLGLLAAVVGAWLRLRRVQLALDEARAGASAPDPAS